MIVYLNIEMKLKIILYFIIILETINLYKLYKLYILFSKIEKTKLFIFQCLKKNKFIFTNKCYYCFIQSICENDEPLSF